jgi:hypothetical protein
MDPSPLNSAQLCARLLLLLSIFPPADGFVIFIALCLRSVRSIFVSFVWLRSSVVAIFWLCVLTLQRLPAVRRCSSFLFSLIVYFNVCSPLHCYRNT